MIGNDGRSIRHMVVFPTGGKLDQRVDSTYHQDLGALPETRELAHQLF